MPIRCGDDQALAEKIASQLMGFVILYALDWAFASVMLRLIFIPVIA